MAFSACAGTQPDTPYDAAEHWSSHPEVALALSEAVVNGMRTMLQDLLISQKWFDDMDISVYEGRDEVLRVRVKSVALQPMPPSRLVAKWQIHSSNDPHLEHIKNIVFSNFTAGISGGADKDGRDGTDPDFLSVEIPQQTARLHVTAKSLSGRVTLVYWRDLSKMEKIISLPMALQPVKSAYSQKTL